MCESWVQSLGRGVYGLASLPLERADVHDRDAVAVAVLHAREAEPRWSVAGQRWRCRRGRWPGCRPGARGSWSGRRCSASGPSFGSIGLVAVPTMSPLTPLVNPVPPVPSPMRLCPWLMNVPDTSGPVPAKSTRFRAMIVLRTLNVPPGQWNSAAAGVGAVLDDGAVEQSRRVVATRCRRRWLPAELPLTVLLVSVAVSASDAAAVAASCR